MRPFFCKIHESLIQEIVDADDKRRFVIFTEPKENGPAQYIRASQGHSGRVEIVDDEALTKIEAGTGWPPCCLHGTTRDNVSSIIVHGLRLGGMPHGRRRHQDVRQHIHFTSSWYRRRGAIPD